MCNSKFQLKFRWKTVHGWGQTKRHLLNKKGKKRKKNPKKKNFLADGNINFIGRNDTRALTSDWTSRQNEERAATRDTVKTINSVTIQDTFIAAWVGNERLSSHN